MSASYLKFKGEYERLLGTVKLTRPDAAMAAARKIFKNGNRYIEASKLTGVPWPFLGVLDLRESDCDPRAGLGQGDPWNQVSTHVPRGKGPFKSWADAAKFYAHYDGLDDPPAPYDMSVVCWMGEKWNGFGPRGKGIFTGYLWAGTNHYTRGKYVADGVWDANHVDTQLGIIPVLWKMVEIDPETYIGTEIIIPSDGAPPAVPEDGPYSLADVMWMQGSLNIEMPKNEDLLRPDGNYGRRTMQAVRNFQRRHPPLAVDGDMGPLTMAAMEAFLKTIGPTA